MVRWVQNKEERDRDAIGKYVSCAGASVVLPQSFSTEPWQYCELRVAPSGHLRCPRVRLEKCKQCLEDRRRYNGFNEVAHGVI